jgi:POT family proton-dependent oligopeptide transporter
MVNKLSPARFASLLMGVWFLSTASANKFAGTLSSLYPEEVKNETSTIKTDSASLNTVLASIKSNSLDSMVFKDDPKASYVLPVATANWSETTGEKSVLKSVSYDSAAKMGSVSVFHLKVIKSFNKNFNSALLVGENELLTYEVVEEVKNSKLVKTDKVQIWNLKPEKPTFAGFTIATLYDFFMLFVFMAGIASVFLFFLSKRLLVLMNGVR